MVVEACRDLGSWYTTDQRQLPDKYHVYSHLAHYMTQLTQMSRRNNSFTNKQIYALATLAVNTRPGIIRVFRALEPLVKSLMFGRVTDDFRQAILNDQLGLLS